jgi:hypothetical protein
LLVFIDSFGDAGFFIAVGSLVCFVREGLLEEQLFAWMTG